MTKPETLTAEERRYLGPATDSVARAHIAKLLRLYDAALALAEHTDMISEFFLREMRAKGMGAVVDAVHAYRATLPRPGRVYEWSRVPAELWANLAHECCAADHWADMRPELLVAIQAVQKAADVSRTTTDSGPSSVDTPDPPPVPVSPAGADLLARVELLERYIGPPALEWARSQPSGPPGVAAAKESGQP